ncbi:MAG TPA: hypothetical protein VFJ76_02995 [Solirubrobacterales bacterium]|nr:hypothetical protein [Solirubrobacterales bacterium]
MLVAAALLAGCGSDSSSNASATDAAPLSKAEFIKQADAICRHGKRAKDNAVAGELEKAAGLSADKEAYAQALAKVVEIAVIPVYSRTIEELGELGAPRKDEAEIAKILGKFEAGLEKAEAHPDKAVEASPFAPGSEAAVAYGLDMCNL